MSTAISEIASLGAGLPEDLQSFVDVLLEGFDRPHVMSARNWPAHPLAAIYGEMVAMGELRCSDLIAANPARVFGDMAMHGSGRVPETATVVRPSTAGTLP